MIWFREGSPKEANRTVAWYKLEWELGLSSGFTQNYSSRSPRVVCAFYAMLEFIFECAQTLVCYIYVHAKHTPNECDARFFFQNTIMRK